MFEPIDNGGGSYYEGVVTGGHHERDAVCRKVATELLLRIRPLDHYMG